MKITDIEELKNIANKVRIGIIEEVYNNSFMIDDDISGDIFIVENEEIKEVYHNF